MIKFYWEKFGDILRPSCVIDEQEKNISCLCCLLTDDGGLGYIHTIDWIRCCLGKIILVRDSSNESYILEREAWGVELSQVKVEIYSMLSDEYVEIINLKTFEVILSAWKDFLEKGESKKNIKFLDIS